MRYMFIVAIVLAILFMVGTVYAALKDQKKLEEGPLKKILEQRKAEREAEKREFEELKKQGQIPPQKSVKDDKWDDDDW